MRKGCFPGIWLQEPGDENKYFIPRKVKFLRHFDVDEEGDALVKAGDIGFATLMPGDNWYLSQYPDGNPVFNSHSVEGVDFEFV